MLCSSLVVFGFYWNLRNFVQSLVHCIIIKKRDVRKIKNATNKKSLLDLTN